ncbi:HNH endonuclease family protein [Flavobacterium saccharophilum]|uniref:TIGR02646 family protein n=1 Tax=Flavobacterium saccharophilum TaxID=29534 RepID=A0A1M7JGT1_9FLAO|nr:hypothetical protein [Flavobacterium saccharophilum]SHM52003.1 hypothetical protein SAMN05444366_3343 [Flavobacterium saccharophilum]
MRTIDISNLEDLLPDGWKENAKVLKDSLEGKTAIERRKIFKDNPIWQDLVVIFKGLSNNKCWYSEAQEVMSDMDIDHFRPKNEAKQIVEGKIIIRDGYWWLAYDWKNYKLSSIYSNRLRKDKHTDENESYGKGSFFPLRNGCIAATCDEELDDEVIYLLNPTNPNDPDLLFFSEDGKAIPSVEQESEPWNYARAEVSIDIYHLNHTPLKDARLVVWNLCQRKIDQIKLINQKAHRTAGDNARIEIIKTELREMILKSSEFSAVALACIEKNKIRMAA